MISLPFALNPPEVYDAMGIGVLLVILMIGLFVKLTAKSPHKLHNERNRRVGLGILALICGPLAGAGLAAVTVAFGGVHRLDVGQTYIVFTVFGSVAGMIAGVAFALTALISPHDRSERKALPRVSQPWDEIS